jgi:hypothetical protein
METVDRSFYTQLSEQYRRGDMREKRRRLMADWAADCESQPPAPTDKVVPIRA